MKKKTTQFSEYKKWTTDEGYTFLAKDLADAELYVQRVGGHLGNIKEVLDER
tara:strand:- start:1637 stop:1792 length:156 start_codon:yes stop_codon:yes gene_type:complete